MSGSNHSMRSVPLDLTNKSRERGSSAQTGDQGRARHTPERQVKPAHKCSNGHGILPPEPRDTYDGSDSQTTQTDDGGVSGNRTLEGPKQSRTVTPSVRRNNQTDAAGKPADSSFSKLPLRKRPISLDVDHDSSAPRNVPHSPCPKVLKHPEGGQIHTSAARISNAFCDIQSVKDSQFVQHVGLPYRKFTICLFFIDYFIFQAKTWMSLLSSAFS